MSLNVYYAKETIYFQGLDREAFEKWGYHISTSNDESTIYLYSMKRVFLTYEKRVRRWLRRHFAPINVPSSYEEDMTVAYLLICTRAAGCEEDVDFARVLLPRIPKEIREGAATKNFLNASTPLELEEVLREAFKEEV